MVIPTAAKPRRRPATYGKACRKKAQTYQGVGQCAIPNDNTCEDTFGRERTISGRIRKDETVRPPGLCRGSPSSSMDLDEPLPSIYNESPKRSITPVIMGSDCPGSFQDKVVYDVSSSDDQGPRSLELRLESSRKRLKFKTVSIEGCEGIAWDDDSLQRHIAAEAAVTALRTVNVAKPPILKGDDLAQSRLEFQKKVKGRSIESGKRATSGLTKGRIDTKSSRSGKVPDTCAPSAKSQDYKAQAPASATAVANFVPLLSTTDSKKIESLGLPPPSRIDAKVDRSLRTQAEFPRECAFTSQSTKTGFNGSQGVRSAKGTTSTAQGLRSAKPIVREKLKVDSPSRLKVYDLHLGGASDAVQTSPVSHEQSCGSQTPSLISPPRVKVKDRLHALNNAAPPSDDTSGQDSAESDSDSSLRTESLESNDKANISLRHEPPSNNSIPTRSISSEASLHQNGGLKVTYARQRSYLTDDSLVGVSMPDTLTQDAAVPGTDAKLGEIRPHPAKAQNFTTHLSPVIDEAVEVNAGAIRSIHELREAGSNVRMTGEIEAVLDDIDKKNYVPVSLMRTGLLEIAAKLQQPEIYRRFMDLGLESRLLDHVDSSADTISRILLLASLLQLLAHIHSPHILSQFAQSRVVSFLARSLENADDLTTMVRNRKSNMSKALQAEVTAFCTSISTSNVWTSGQPTRITGQVLSMQCLEHLVRHLREAGSTADIVSDRIVRKLVDILMPGEGNDYISEIRLIPEVHMSLSILESSSIARTLCTAKQETPWTSDSIAKMARFLAIIQVQTGSKVEFLRTLALRLCLNLTNNNTAICEVFSNHTLIHATLLTFEANFRVRSTNTTNFSTELLLDNLVLSLGFLINLAEWSQATRELFLRSQEGHPPHLDTLSRIFESNLEGTSEVRFFELVSTEEKLTVS